jgi:hypothetical protein
MTNLDHANRSDAIVDITEQDAAHSDASSHECAAIRKTENVAARPPAPSKFTRRQVRTPCVSVSLPQLATRPDLSCVQAMRRHMCEQIYDSELCPVIGKPEQEDLWASLDNMFML